MTNKKEFTKDELYEYMKYIIYCVEIEISIKSCSSRENYQEFFKKTEKHSGDCTQENCACLKCKLNEIEIIAQNSVDHIFYEKIEEPIIPNTKDIYEASISPDVEESEYFWEHNGLEKILKATKKLIEKHPKEFKKIVEEI